MTEQCMCSFTDRNKALAGITVAAFQMGKVTLSELDALLKATVSTNYSCHLVNTCSVPSTGQRDLHAVSHLVVTSTLQTSLQRLGGFYDTHCFS